MEKTTKENIIKFIMAMISAGVVGFLAVAFYNHYNQPSIRCVTSKDKIEFTLEKDYRTVLLRLYPQLVICYGDTIFLLVHLEDYYDEEFLQFDAEGRCNASKQHQDYVGKLQGYLRAGILKRVEEAGGIDMQTAEEQLNLYVSNIGGVRYENSSGNTENRYCIIEQDGMIIDYDVKDQEIINRLFEMKLVMGNDLLEIESNEDIAKIIQVIAEEIVVNNG